MYVLKRDKVEIIGKYTTLLSAIVAMEEELKKGDGKELSIEQENEKKGSV